MNIFGINYDIGNSAALNFNPIEEFNEYGKRVQNVHIKDRLQGGGTVPLTTGNANFEVVFNLLHKNRYRGNYILQTSRANDNNHAELIKKNKILIEHWINKAKNN